MASETKSATNTPPGASNTQADAGMSAYAMHKSPALSGVRTMRIGVPREIKVHEYRVGLVPAGVRELTAAGHEVVIETGAGAGIGMEDAQYRAAGAAIAPDA